MNRFAPSLGSPTAGFNTARLNHSINPMSNRQHADIGFTRETTSLRALEQTQSR